MTRNAHWTSKVTRNAHWTSEMTRKAHWTSKYFLSVIDKQRIFHWEMLVAGLPVESLMWQRVTLSGPCPASIGFSGEQHSSTKCISLLGALVLLLTPVGPDSLLTFQWPEKWPDSSLTFQWPEKWPDSSLNFQVFSVCYCQTNRGFSPAKYWPSGGNQSYSNGPLSNWHWLLYSCKC